MRAKVRVFKHSLHRILVGFPITFLTSAVVLDLVYFATEQARFSVLAMQVMGLGIIASLIVAPIGWIDWYAIAKETRAKSVGLFHGIGNVLMVGLFTLSWLVREDILSNEMPLAYALSFAGIAILGVTGWLGGELVECMGVSIDVGAHENAPSSFSKPYAKTTDSVTTQRAA